MDRTSARRSSVAPPATVDQGRLQGIQVIVRKEKQKQEKTSVLIKLSKMNEGASSGTGGPWELPALYIGGKYLGGVDKVMESHINGELVPMLREVGALWLWIN
ncbi:Glutaredoxin-C9 [Capsicum chinense]|nr:Glutaredoxin-C9 [Capsicum chinense]